MLIGVLSDTHDDLASIDKAFRIFENHAVEIILHCGDWKSLDTYHYIQAKTKFLNSQLYGVTGNQDHELATIQQLTTFHELFLEETSIAIVHGHIRKDIENALISQKYHLIMTGHTHKYKVSLFNNSILLNPGSTSFSIPRQKNYEGTVAILSTKKPLLSSIKIIGLETGNTY